MKVFLGGTCNGSTWRADLIRLLHKEVQYFDPVITDREWTEEDRYNEIVERGNSDLVVYVFTPRMSGLYSIAEVTDDSNKRPDKTIVCILDRDVNDEDKRVVFTPAVKKSMEAIAELIKNNGAIVCRNLEEVAEILNNKA